MIHTIPEKYDLAIGYTWYSGFNQGVCGHMFEMIEYYYILRKHYKTCMMVCEKDAVDTIEQVMRQKYDFTEEEIVEFLNDIVHFEYPRIVKGKNLLLVDGNFTGMRGRVLMFDNIIAFPCNDLLFQEMDGITVLQDDRIYGKGHNTINYTKKILFDRYRDVRLGGDRKLVYATENSRKLGREFFDRLEEEYDGDFLLLTDDGMSNLSNRFVQEELPIDDLFSKFDTYVYTPTPRQRDCSPRFITECRFYGKSVEYFNIDYMERDFGLCFRRYDIENNFEGLFLREDDPVIDILKGLI